MSSSKKLSPKSALADKYNKFHEGSSYQKKLITKNNFTYRHILRYIEKYLDLNRKINSILDIGCGTGTIDFYIASKYKKKKIYGIDISSKAISACNQSTKILGLHNIKFEVVNFPKDVPPGKFDFVILTEVIEHITDDNLALKSVYSLLNRGGILILTTPSQNAPLHKLHMTHEFDMQVGHLRRYSLDKLIHQCESTGLKVIESEKCEGIVRNFLFINPIAGKFVRFIKYFLSDIVTLIDNITLKLFGESNLIIIAKKP